MVRRKVDDCASRLCFLCLKSCLKSCFEVLQDLLCAERLPRTRSSCDYNELVVVVRWWKMTIEDKGAYRHSSVFAAPGEDWTATGAKRTRGVRVE